MSKGKVLVVGSNGTRIEIQGGGTGPTGQYLNETVVPAMAVIDAGYEVVLATPNGTQPYIDPPSDSAAHFGGDENAYRRARAFFDKDPSMTNVRTLRSILEEGLDNYAAVFVPGGRLRSLTSCRTPNSAGSCDTSTNERSRTALLCHGPIATLAALPDAKGYRAALIAGDKVRAAALQRAGSMRDTR